MSSIDYFKKFIKNQRSQIFIKNLMSLTNIELWFKNGNGVSLKYNLDQFNLILRDDYYWILILYAYRNFYVFFIKIY